QSQMNNTASGVLSLDSTETPTVNQAFQGNYILLADYVNRYGRYPTVPEIAGKAIIFYPGPEYPRNGFPAPPFEGTLLSTSRDTGPSKEEVESLMDGPGGFRVPRAQAYGEDPSNRSGCPPYACARGTHASPSKTAQVRS